MVSRLTLFELALELLVQEGLVVVLILIVRVLGLVLNYQCLDRHEFTGEHEVNGVTRELTGELLLCFFCFYRF